MDLWDEDYCVKCDRVVDIVDVHDETEVTDIYGTGVTWRVWDFSCGHGTERRV